MGRIQKPTTQTEGSLYLDELEIIQEYPSFKWTGTCYLPVFIFSIIVFTFMVVIPRLSEPPWGEKEIQLTQNQIFQCQQSCKISVVESIPEGLTYNDSQIHLSTFDAWMQLLNLAKQEINLGSMYWDLLGHDCDDPSSEQGKTIFKRLMEKGQSPNLRIRIAQNIDSPMFPNVDTHELENTGAAEIRRLNFTRLMGGGILHTKFWIVDSLHAYIGSANFDWKSLTQVKELGLLVTDCSCFVQDLTKIFNAYWMLGQNNSKVPSQWPSAFNTNYGMRNPMQIAFNDTPYATYLSSSPPPFCARGRTTDIDSILDVIDSATKFVHISVMDYIPAAIYGSKPKFWPIIDDHLRRAAIDRSVGVKLLISKWNHTKPSTYNYLKSLRDLNQVYPHVDIQIKLFEVPSTPEQAKIPFARVNHNKYMVTEDVAYVGTSNWSADYFIDTAGVGVIMYPRQNSTRNVDKDMRGQIQDIFDRDWNSAYAFDLPV